MAQQRRANGRWRAVGIAGVVLVAGACGSTATDDPDPARTADETKPSEVTAVELPALLTGSRVTIGSAYGGDRVLVLAHGGPDAEDSLWAIDADTAEVEQMSGLPFDGWIGDAELTSTDEFAVISARTCSNPPVDGDAGFECHGEATTVLAVHDFAAGRWVSDASPIDSLASVVGMTGDSAEVAGPAATEDGTPRRLRWSLDLRTGEQSVPSEAPEPLQCMDGGRPALRFEGSGASQVGVLAAPDVEEPQRYPLPVDVEPLSAGLPGVLLCYSSGPFLGIPGATETQPSPQYPAGEEASANPTTTTSGPPGDPRVTVYDLRHPDRDPTKVGETNSVTAFVSGDDYWALQDAGGIHIFRSSSGVHESIGTVQHPSAGLGGLIGTESSLLAVSRGPNGSLAGLHRIAP